MFKTWPKLPMTVTHLLCSEGLDHLSSVDLHRALDLAHAICCTCLLSLVRIDALKVLQPAKNNLRLATLSALHREACRYSSIKTTAPGSQMFWTILCQ